MIFEERELKPHAEPVPASDLKEGSIYFFVNFVDDEMLLPTLEPFVFIGKNLEKDDSGRVYFQDVDSFQRGIAYDSEGEDRSATFYSGSENELGHIFEHERALDILMACSLRRRSLIPRIG
jgi:hypothetical protein